MGVAAVLLAAFAYLMARVPRRLVQHDLGLVHERSWELGLAVGLLIAAIGCLLFASAGLVGRSALGVVMATLVAVIYYDFRFLIIPDLCTLSLAVAALVSPIALPLRDALFGAAVCAALVGAVAWVWKKRTGIDGMGFGDVKLSAALGALLGLQSALWTITAAAFTGAVLGYLHQIARRRTRSEDDAPMVVPFGAALALAGGGFMIWSHR